MAKITIKNIMEMGRKRESFDFDSLTANPLYSYIPQPAVELINKTITDPRLASKIKQKYSIIDSILTSVGFKKLGCGTNRIVYECLYDDRIVMKIALDRVGLKDNPREFINQNYLKPHICKIFEVSPCGTVAIVEKVQPITSRRQFKAMAQDIFKLMISNILGKYVMDDIGIKYFMNYGLRDGFGPIIIDYPYVFPLDNKKLVCKSNRPGTNIPCCGDIDYDDGFNQLVCTSCGKYYQASDLGKAQNLNIEICKKKGKSRMKVRVYQGNKKILESDTSKETKSINRKNRFDVTITQGKEKVCDIKKDEFDTSSTFIPEPKEEKVETVSLEDGITVDETIAPTYDAQTISLEDEVTSEDKQEETVTESSEKEEVVEDKIEETTLDENDDAEDIEEYLDKKYGKGGRIKNNRKKNILYDQY